MAILTKGLCSLLLLLCGCSGLEKSEEENLRRQHAKGEFIYRHHDEMRYAIQTPPHCIRDKYPWEKTHVGSHLKITKEYFRCRGSSVNPPHPDHKDPTRPANYFDCGGSAKHSLPLYNDQEFVYPILIDLLNYLQAKTGCKVVITCGHRCPTHNSYADNTVYNQNSKHMIGAEVDFYLQGMEQKSEEVVRLIMDYYKDTPAYQNDKQYLEFQRLTQTELNVSTPPWYNKARRERF
jgi:hypothetical protein